MNRAECYRKFKESRQEKLRLEIALQEFFAEEKLSEAKEVEMDGSAEKEAEISGKAEKESEIGGKTEEEFERAWQEEYGKYLKMRIRPAMETLIARGDVDKTEKLLEYGWIDSGQLDEFIRKALQQEQRAVLLCLLHFKNKTFGFKDREFEFYSV